VLRLVESLSVFDPRTGLPGVQLFCGLHSVGCRKAEQTNFLIGWWQYCKFSICRGREQCCTENER
jgi:hypothetical protein